MNLEKIFDIRFTAPVGIMVLFVFLFSPKDFICLMESLSGVSWVLSITGVLGLGFMISSLGDILSRSKYFYYLEDPKKELEIWRTLDYQNKENREKSCIPDQIYKRWSIGVANLNAFFGIIFGLTITIILVLTDYFKSISCYWYILCVCVSILFLIIFFKQGKKSIEEVKKMNELLAKDKLTRK